ncbi:hypothetical protein GCM10028833_18910 [Glycomyces tarimensis]
MHRASSTPLVAVLAAIVVALTLMPITPTYAAQGPDLAEHRAMSASSHTQTHVAGNAADGNDATYWESANYTFPQWLQVDLGSSYEVSELVVSLPDDPAWETRTQTMEVQGSTDGTSFTTIVGAADYTFDPAAGNSVTITFDAVPTRHLRLLITANTAWPAGQVAEFEVYGEGEPPAEPNGANLAPGRPIEASSQEFDFAAENANDGDLTTYWEGASGALPSTLTVELGADAAIEQIVVKLNPDPAWGPRTQTLSVLGRDQGGGEFSTIKSQADYAFAPDGGNTVTIPVSATVAEVRLQFSGNTGAPNGQVAELEVYGTPAPNPDLVVTDLSWSPAEPDQTDELTLTATVENSGDLASPATDVGFFLDDALVGTAPVDALEPGAGATATAAIEPRPTGEYELGARVDPDGAVIERNEGNNAYTDPNPLVVKAIDTSDLVAAASWSPSNPAAGDTVTFSATVKNQGTLASDGGPHGITLTVTDDDTGETVATLSDEHSGAIGAGDAAGPVELGTWTAADGGYTVTIEVEPDGNEHAVQQGNNSSARSLYIGRGADVPYTMDEAEDATTGGGAQVVGPNRTIGDLAGEASGRRAVVLDGTGEYVEFTTSTDTNTLVTRFAIPDAPGGGGIDATLNVYVDGELLQPIDLTSRYAWLYGNEASPDNSPGSGAPRHIYDEANVLLDQTIPAGSTIRLQKDGSNSASFYAIDFISLEAVAPNPNPDPARYIEPDGFGHQDVQAALDEFRMDTTGELLGVYLPPGDYQTAQKFQVHGKAVEMIGAGPWYTRFLAPQGQSNTDVGIRADATANGSTFSGFAYFGNYVTRIDGPGKIFDWQNVSDMTIDNMWVEHQVCMFWGSNISDTVIKNSRTRNLFADALNMTNGSANNLVQNIESRASGDDSFALFAATDSGGGDQTGNVYENLTSILTWRAAGLAVYGGFGNTFRNIHIADTLVYSGVTISSLDFGIPMDGFGADPKTRFENISVVRAGGHFWGQQTFPGIWIFSGDKEFQGIRIDNVDIVDPTYAGIMFQTKYTGGQPEHPVTDTVFTDVTITGAQLSGDEFEHKSGIGIWVNEMPEQGQGPAVGSAIFQNLQMSNNHEDIRNTTDTFDLIIE